MAGLYGRRGMFPSLFGAMTASFFMTVSSILFSVPMNLSYYRGYTGNTFGNGVTDFLIRGGVNRYISYFIGEFYIDFADKVLTLLLLSLLILLYRWIRRKKDIWH